MCRDATVLLVHASFSNFFPNEHRLNSLAGLFRDRGYPAAGRLNNARPRAGLTAPPRFPSGVVNDYVTWIVLGLACVGGVLAFIVE